MTTETVHPDLVEIALDRVEGFAFERFAQDFLSVLEGKEFIPVGGIGDGGADGIYDSGNGRSFYQFTRQENHRDKIRKTVQRLQKFGRNVKTLYYLTARLIPHIDSEEELLTDKLDVNIKIRDRKYILSHINDTNGTTAAFTNHLSTYTQFLSNLANQSNSSHSPHIDNPSAFVFLQHEVTNRLGNRKLVHSIADTMILWALSETDPDKGIFMTEAQIAERIFSAFPWASKILKSHLKQRLESMRNKKEGGRELRWYKKEGHYCLPYETRQVIAAENAADESLGIQFIEELKIIAGGLFDADEGVYQKIAELASKVIHSVFEKQGLLFAYFLSDAEEGMAPPIVADCIDEVIKESIVQADNIENYRELLENMIRKVFYEGSPRQRKYLSNLSRTYVLLFTLQAEPRIVEYFSTMSASFRLYLGTDVLIKAISERYLTSEDQVARNLLKLAKSAGVSMHLSECVLEEVYTHIRATYFEFANYFADMEPYITREVARNSDKILIRAYFYAKDEGLVNGWKAYLEQFITYDKVLTAEGKEEIRKYLMAEYGLFFTANSELESVTKEDQVKKLTETLLENDDKENEALAYNTSLLVYGIYGLRQKHNEIGSASEYGLKTWWMTNQSRVLQHTAGLIRDNHAKYIMRPDFLLHFISLSPTCNDVRDNFKSIFPSIFGIQLGHRLKEDVFHKIMSSVKEWKGLEPGRISARMASLSDSLKGDRLKRYDRTIFEQMP
ncbi:hypothetical protein [Marichromatium gracile]|uniref:hypothetical protein n=1 Tax=Marichromatium gracile TaxID=1048 RepID=UPI0012907DB6|nr:hypothetical protein [Marichromatium gracile]